MNVVQLQDMLRGLPDDRLKQELSQPTGTVPQYLVLSEVVRRDKMRESAASAPQTTVVQDIIGTPQPAQQQAFANGGFISPAQSMANAGVRGFAPQAPKPPMQFGMNNSAPQMFTPNTTPQPPAPVTNNNVNVQTPSFPQPQPQFDGGQQDGPNEPSFYEQPNGYADGGVIGLANGGPPPAMAELLRKEAARLGIDPVDLATVISYETAGTFSPTIKGGAKTKWGEHIGLIQMGDPQREQYGYDPQGDLPGQVAAVGRYLEDRGVQPGMGLLDVYSTINAGAPGLYNRSDEAAGGAPGTVAEKVANQMEGHREKAARLLGTQEQPAPTQEAALPMMNPADRELGILSGGVMPDSRQRGIGSFFADAFSNPAAKKDMLTLGSKLYAKSQENTAPEAPGISRGDPRLVQNIGGPSADEMLAQYQALRSGYMANGGAVRMRDGMSVPRLPSWATESILPEYFFDAPDFTGMRTFENPEGVPIEEQTTSPEEYGGTNVSSSFDRAGTRGPLGLGGEATKTPVFDTASAPEGPSSLDRYLGAYQSAQQQIADIYREQAEAERKREEEAGGLPFLLRQLGIGMIASGGNLQQGLRGGLEQAFSAREEQTQAARDKIRELQLKGKMTDIEAASELAKLRYQSEVEAEKLKREGMMGRKDYRDLYKDAAKSYADAIKEGNATDEQLAELRATAEYYANLAGISAPPSGVDPAALAEARRRGIIQ